MCTKYLYTVALSTENPKEPEIFYFVADSLSDVFACISKNEDYLKRFISVNMSTMVISL